MFNIFPRFPEGMDVALARARLHAACTFASPETRERLVRIPCTMMGLSLPNLIGIAAGFDRTGRFVGRVSATGFGHLEIGSVTPENLNATLANLRRRIARSGRDIVGVNVACLRNAVGDDAIGQYINTAQSCMPFADYLVINFSSPFTRSVQAGSRQWRETLLGKVADVRDRYQMQTERVVPLGLKISLAQGNEEQALEDLQTARAYGFQGAVAATPRDMAEVHVQQALIRAKKIIADMTLISVGGIATGAQVRGRLRCGVEAVQLFSAIISHGPTVAHQLISELSAESQPTLRTNTEIP